MTFRLLATKFHIPAQRSGMVARPRLIQQLQQGLTENLKLTLVSSPAGYGKTTLVVDWIAHLQSVTTKPNVKISWLSLEITDNDPRRFLHYFMAAFQQAEKTLGEQALAILEIPGLLSLEGVLDALLNDLTALDTPHILVLDDYHLIDNTEIHTMMEYFLDHLPACVHLVMTTRADPPLPLARFRARRQMTEIRASDLRFTVEEASQFINQFMRLDLPPESIRALDERTEGWAVGLQLAALAMQNQTDRQGFILAFGGSHRFLVDYLLEEVLKHQPTEISAFLTQTSILPRFNAALCQAVTGHPDSAEILEQLDRENLFLIPLDGNRGWYRYHSLFAEALRLGVCPEEDRDLHSKAAAWFEANGWISEALVQWQAVPDSIQTARLIAILAPDLLRSGEAQILLSWLIALPKSILNESPELVSYYALSLLMTGQTEACRSFASSIQTEDGRLLAVQAWISASTGSPETMELAHSALDKLEEDDSIFHALALQAQGSQFAWNANLTESSQVFRQSWKLGQRMKHPFMAISGLANLAFNLVEMGQMREAETLCRDAFEEYVDLRGRPLPVLGILHAPLAAICYEKHDLEEAQILAERGIAICQQLFSNDIMGGDNEITLARITLDQGEVEKGIGLLRSIAKTAYGRGMTIIVYKMALAEAELHLLEGNVIGAEEKFHEVEALTHPQLSKSGWMTTHLQARIQAAKGNRKEALESLSRLVQTNPESGAIRRQMGIQLTQALLYEQMRDRSTANRLFMETISWAAAEGYRSLFFPYPGRPTRSMLESARSTYPEFVATILRENPIMSKQKSAHNDPLIDPLSSQEIRVLKMIIAGKSNAEIASELVISVGTAKWHVHNILQKLGVTTRTQAIARTKEFDI